MKPCQAASAGVWAVKGGESPGLQADRPKLGDTLDCPRGGPPKQTSSSIGKGPGPARRIRGRAAPQGSVGTGTA